VTDQTRAAWMVAAAVWAALIVAVAGQVTGSVSHYPWWTNAMVYAVSALMGAWVADRIIAWRTDHTRHKA
jgi:hypothetical protein